MSRPDEWVWGTVNADHLALAEAVMQRWLARVREANLQTRHAHTSDRKYQNRTGAQGEVAFYVVAGWPMPTLDQITNTWKGPDVEGGLTVKTIGQPKYRLLFDDSDLEGVTVLVLVYNNCPRFAIVGWIEVPRALEVRYWEPNIQRPAWAVDQRHLRPWSEFRR